MDRQRVGLGRQGADWKPVKSLTDASYGLPAVALSRAWPYQVILAVTGENL